MTVHEDMCVRVVCAHVYVCACACVHVCVCVCLTNIFRDTFVVNLLLVCWHNYCNVVRECIKW